MKIIGPIASFVALTLTARALGISWPWALAWGVLFAGVTAAALVAAKTARPRNPLPWLIAGAVVSALPVVVALVRGRFDTPALLSGACALIFIAAAASVRGKRKA